MAGSLSQVKAFRLLIPKQMRTFDNFMGTIKNSNMILRSGGSLLHWASPLKRELGMVKSRLLGRSMSHTTSYGKRGTSLPSPAILLSSDEGRQILHDAGTQGNTKVCYELISNYQAQPEPKLSGATTLSMVFNSFQICPNETWKGDWQWCNEGVLFGPDLERIKMEGTSLMELENVARNNNACVEVYKTNDTSKEEFRAFVKKATSSACYHIIVSYDRRFVLPIGGGHFAAIGAYNEVSDFVLLLDVNSFICAPHWVPLSILWKAMHTIDPSDGNHRGFMLLFQI